ncbi:MAG: DegT/DnrJ/EryC1/StrS family aminotransferase [Deltaproteobacteria bacterium]|nr:DegT/DnrJ/EryC1/StrS family aminotransferase [Deltaproteobacteria bacterium]
MVEKGNVPVAGVVRELAALRPRILAALERVLASGRVVRGPSIERFEREWARFLGVRHVVLAHSGTSALAAALAAAGVGRGDDVLVPALTFPGTAEAVLAVGAVPVAVDVAPETLLLDVSAALRALGPRTRAVVPVHLYGQVHPDLPRLARALRRRGIAVIEDACQAHGAFAPGARPAQWSAAAAYSFYPTKNLGTVGEAGAIATDDDELVVRLRALRDHGSTGGAAHAAFGVNLWPGQLEAAILSVKLPRLRGWNEARRRMARRYDRALAGCSAVRPVANVTGEGHVYHQYVVRCTARDELRRLLSAAGIETAVYYPRTLLELPGLAGRLRRRGPCPNAAAAAREVLSLPVHPWLTAAERKRCVEAVGEAAGAIEVDRR